MSILKATPRAQTRTHAVKMEARVTTDPVKTGEKVRAAQLYLCPDSKTPQHITAAPLTPDDEKAGSESREGRQLMVSPLDCSIRVKPWCGNPGR